jgi:tetratricopeptide (TPR) repeat protein
VEPSLRNGHDSGSHDTPTFEKQKPTRSSNKKIINFIKRFWYIFLIAGIVIGVVIGWSISSAREAAAWQRATDAFSRADYESAKKDIDGVAVPGDQDKLKVYAQTMLATRTLDKALVGYENLYKQTKDPATLLILGNIYNQQQKYDKAISTYKDVIANNENNIQAYVNLATVYKLQQKSDEAVATATQAVEKNQKSAVAHELLVSMLLDKKGSDAYNKAIADLKALNPNDPLLESINAQ